MPSPADELLIPAAARVTLALGGGLGVILAVERHRLRTLGSSTLFVRWRTWLITAPIFGAAVMWSRWGAVAFAALLSAQGLREYARMAGLGPAIASVLVGTGAAGVVLAALAPTAWLALPMIFALTITLVPIVRDDAARGATQVADAGFGLLWIAMPLGTLVLIRDAFGPGVLLAVGMAVALSDVLAFLVGRAAGRTSLARAISPTKTVQGLAGNLLGATAGVALMSFALAGIGVGARLVLPIVIALGCVWGDLVESMVKRRAGVKDAGGWLPGFGGLLDRIDSMLLVLPLVYGTLEVLGR